MSFAQGKQGCGFGGANQEQPPAEEAPAQDNGNNNNVGNGVADNGAAGSQNVGLGNGQQFITGQCLSDADCASACCAGRVGSETAACSAVLVANADGKTGCGFGA